MILSLVRLIYKLFFGFLYCAIYKRLKFCYLYFNSNASKELDVNNQVVLITGAANGIGREIALNFLSLPKKQSPKKLILWDYASLEEFEILQNPVEIECAKVDMSDYEKVNQLIEVQKAKNINIDIVIFNAGIANTCTVKKITFDAFRKVMDVNFTANVNLTKTCLEHFNLKNLVYMASVASYTTPGTLAAYVASKHALRSFAECLHQELLYINSNINVHVICPFFVSTNMTNQAISARKKEKDGKARNKLFWLMPVDISNAVFTCIHHNIEHFTVGWLGYVIYYLRVVYGYLIPKGLDPLK